MPLGDGTDASDGRILIAKGTTNGAPSHGNETLPVNPMTVGARSTAQEITVLIGSEFDIITARQSGRALASQLGCTSTDATMIATAISELARNILFYAGHGEILLAKVKEEGAKHGIVVVARDEGPGIADVPRAIAGGYSTSGGLGLGLSGVRRLMDEFEIASELGKGTTVTVRRWKR
jgi:serine/threonine-protein kinase RsbT